MIGLAFRNCEPFELKRIQQLVDQLYASDPNTRDVHPSIELTFAEFSYHPDKGRLIAFDDDGQIVGYAILVFFFSNEYGNNLIEVDELYIEESHRSKGIATRFFSWLADNYSSNSAGWTLQVADTNAGAAKLYERLGFKLSRNRHLIHIFGSGHR